MNNNPIKKIQLNFDEQFSNSKLNKVENKNNLKEVAQEFESLFVFQMLKSARKAKLADGILDGQAHSTYQTLLDQEYSKSMAKNQNFGIAEALLRQFGDKKEIK
tara:strand:- start:122 stop:433 length:312 start_codon:yes stop_codon:yes gene_type:complete